MITVEARGFKGGIWLLWNRHDVEIEELSSTAQILIVLVREGRGLPCLLSIMYASPNPFDRAELWTYLSQLGGLVGIPWAVMGDTNQPLDLHDKLGGHPINLLKANKLWEAINNCRLLDMGFQGPRFTWTNCHTGTTKIRERIDRAWCNLEWQRYFSTTIIRHLARLQSDHHPLLLHIPTTPVVRYTGFRFLEPWF